MKKMALAVACILGALSLCFRCESEDPFKDSGQYYVKNCTDRELHITIPDHYMWLVNPNDSVMIFYTSARQTPRFSFLEEELLAKGEDGSMEVLSKDGELMKSWAYSDFERPGKQFLKESSWRHFTNLEEYGSKIAVWVFDISKNDIIDLPVVSE